MSVRAGLPTISIVTSSYNQGGFIGRTIDSVLAQDYPRLQHIVVDGLSTDDTAEVLARYGHLQVIRERDRGQADAINKGFRAATGDILAFLNSDDTLEPGALHAVADAFAASSDRRIVMGRCRFIDEADRFLGVEHPSAFESHRRVLEIWKGHCLPQPAIFWRREVWDTCGPMHVDEQLMLDYDLFCRFSQRYRFHRIDRILANYRLHTQSKTTGVSDESRLEQAIAVSRRYWGPPWSLQYWQIRASYAAFRLNRRARAARLMRSGRDLYRDKRYLAGAASLAAGAALAPDVAADVAVPAIRPALARIRQIARARRRAIGPHTQAWFGNHAVHSDGWAGPTIVVDLPIQAGDTTLELVGTHPAGRPRKPLTLEAFLDGRSLGVRTVGRVAEFSVTWPIAAAPGAHQLRVVASDFIVPHDRFGNQDYRPLAYRLIRVAAAGNAHG